MASTGSALAHATLDYDDIEHDLLDLFDDGSEDFFLGEPETDSCSDQQTSTESCSDQQTESCSDQQWMRQDEFFPSYPVSSSCSYEYDAFQRTARDIYRKQAIARWLCKREKRSFSKRKVVKSSSTDKKIIPKRSTKDGRFVKCTTSFVSITELQRCESN